MYRTILSALSFGLRQGQALWRARRQQRRARDELTRMGEHELRDLGLSHRAMAGRELAPCRSY